MPRFYKKKISFYKITFLILLFNMTEDITEDYNTNS